MFLSFSPFFGLQIALGIGSALLFRFSRIAVLIGLCCNLPWIMIPWYALTTAAGAAVLGGTIRSDFSARLAELLDVPVYRAIFWQRATDLLGPFLASFILGSTAGALIIGLVTYAVTVRLLAARGLPRALAG